MKIAILSVTKQGKIISNNLYENLIKNPLILEVTQYHKHIKDTIKNIFNKYDCIIAIMASGIIIRSIAHYIHSKLSDPAILLIDDKSNFVISLLSGHIGGANDLTLKIASIINATPVITTSTDVNNKIGIDSIAKRYFFLLKNPENVQYINKALVNNITVDLYLPSKYSFIISKKVEDSYNIHIDNTLEIIKSSYDNHEVLLYPKRLVMGIGARKNISASKVKNAITQACNILEIHVNRIDLFATVDVKAKEQGILDNIEKLNKPLKIVPTDSIKNYQNEECSKSDFVMQKFGVQGVCEPACLIINGENSHLIFKKTAYDGVTIAISVNEKYNYT